MYMKKGCDICNILSKKGVILYVTKNIKICLFQNYMPSPPLELICDAYYE